MAVRTLATFKAIKNSRYADNSSGAVTAQNSRDMFEDAADSFAFLTDVGGSSLLSVTKVISTAEMLTGNSVPVTVLAAQGAGTIIQPIGPIVWKWNYVTAAFATNTVSKMFLGTVAVPITSNNSVISLANIRYELLDLIDVDSTQANAENAPILWAVNSGDPTAGGTSTLTVHFKYYVLTL